MDSGDCGDAGDGRVLLGGRDIRTLPLDDLREQIALVGQDTYLFHGTVAENLRLGKPGATEEELLRAAEVANARAFIDALPEGLNTLIGERGVRLSGGQRQRIAIARAVLKDAPILVLDEALSSVDAENESIIREALARLQAGRTTLVIAHRLSSVIDADRILVLERGELVESGTHAELLASNGPYTRLMAAQQSVEVELRAPTGSPVEAAATAGAEFAQSVMSEAVATAPAANVWMRMLRLTGTRWWELALGWTAGILQSSASIGVGVIGALLVREVVTGGDITPFVVALLVLAPLASILAGVESWVCHDLAFRLLVEMRNRLYRFLDPLAPAYLQRRRTGDVVSLATGDVETLELFYAHSIAPALTAILLPTGVLIALTVYSWQLGLVLAPFLLAVAFTPLIGGRLMARLGAQLREAMGAMNAVVVDSIQGVGTLLAFGHGPHGADDLDRRGDDLSRVQVRFLRDQSLQRAAIELLTGLGGLAVLTVGAALVTDGRLDRADLPLVTVLAFAAFAPVAEVVATFKQLGETLASARRYFAIEDEPVPVRDGRGVALQPTSAGGHRPGLAVSFQDVGFSYQQGGRPALSDVAFDVQPGQTVALVGKSGAGKTTAAHLLLRFWDPTSGSILLEGHDIRDFELDELRQHIALVAQETYLFNATLMENLRLGRPNATDEEVFEAARRANVDEFAQAMPEGYETTVGERGLQLSGGQRQRISIARALLKDAPVLVLDEATSHLDAVNEAEVRQALETLMRGRTTLVIAHRLSTIRNADSIIVLDEGHIREQGTHAELLARDGLYSHLVGSQLIRSATPGQGPTGQLRPV